MVNRQWVTLGLVMTAVVATAGTAIGLTREPASPVRTAAEVYSADMSLKEVSELSQGSPGLVAPPCPTEDHVARLKEAGLPVGPCDPFPEPDNPVVIPKEGQVRPDGPLDAALCVSITGQDAAHWIDLPCAAGVKFVATNDVKIDGEDCTEVTYIPAEGEARRTETLCPSSPVTPGGARMGRPEQEHERAASKADAP
jgi:hypothetical protein